MKKELLLSAVLGLSAFTVPVGTVSAQTILARTPMKVSAAAQMQKNANGQLKNDSPMAKVQPVKVDELAKYGELVTIMHEDFSKMATGSVGNHDKDAEITSETISERPVWINVLPEYTQMPGWGGHFIWPAGGTVAIAPLDYGNLNTPMLNLAGNDGIAVITLKVRTEDGAPAQTLVVEAAETFNMSPSWRILGGQVIDDITDEWKTYSFMIRNAGEYTMFNLPVSKKSPDDVLRILYIDDITVSQIKPFVNMPKLLPHTNYTDTSFEANWEKVEGADGYLLNVYTLTDPADPTSAKNYVVKNEEVKGTSYNVTDLDPGLTYYYTVRSKKGDKESFESDPMEVYDIVKPVLGSTKPENAKYTASWPAVHGAEVYNYWAYYTRTATTTGDFTITNEGFDEIDLPESAKQSEREEFQNWQNYSIDNPIYLSFDKYLVEPANQAGWIAKNGMPYKHGYVAVDGYQSVFNKDDAGLVSPELDLSKDGGKITVSAKLSGGKGTVWIDNQPVERIVKCAVALFNWSDAKGDYEQSELVYIDDVDKDWKDYSVTLTKGTSRSKVGLYAVYAPAHLFFDSVKLTQKYNEGESFKDPFFFKRYLPETSLEVAIPARVGGAEIYHRATAIKTNPLTKQLKESDMSDYTLVGSDPTASVGSISLANAPVKVENGCLIVETTEAVSVYTVDGALIFNSKSGNVNLPLEKGVYVVKVGNNSVKLTF